MDVKSRGVCSILVDGVCVCGEDVETMLRVR